MKRIIAIVGPSGSGKTELANRLGKAGMRVVETYTTRPERYPSEKGHRFVSKGEYDAIEEKLFEVKYNNDYYCTSKFQLLNSDIIVLEPRGVFELVEWGKKNEVQVVVLALLCNAAVRKERMIQRGDGKEKIASRLLEDEQVFDKLCEDVVKAGVDYKLYHTGNVSAAELSKQVLMDFKKTKIYEVPHNKRFRLLCDMDDILENLGVEWLKLLGVFQQLNPEFIPKKYEEIKSWYITNEFPMLSIDEVFEPLNTECIWRMIRPLPGAQAVVEKWQNDPRIDFRILTSTHYSAALPKREFLREYYPFLKWDQMIITSEKQYIKGDVLIDDHTENLIGGDYKGILLTYNRNKDFDCERHNIVRAANWDEIDKAVEKMLEEKFA